MEDCDFYFKVVLIGSMSVGKSCIFLRYIKGTYRDKHQNTVGVEFGSKVVQIDTREGLKNVKLQIWDTAGSERYKSMAKSYYKGAVGIVLAYDIADEESFLALPEWISLIHSLLDPKELSVVLVGNKADKESERQVTRARGEEFAQRHHFLFREVSALKGTGITECFETLAREIQKLLIRDNFDSLRMTEIEGMKAAKPDQEKPKKLEKKVNKKEKEGGCSC